MPLSRRQGNLLGFAACAGLMGYALYAQYGLGLVPCPLCTFQRGAMIATGLVLLLAGLHNPDVGGSRVYGTLALLTAGGGAAIAGRHVWMQSLPPDQVPACGPDLNFMLESMPFAQVLEKVFAGSGQCAEIDWQFLGLSMPAWTLTWFAGMALAYTWWNWRRADGL